MEKYATFIALFISVAQLSFARAVSFCGLLCRNSVCLIKSSCGLRSLKNYLWATPERAPRGPHTACCCSQSNSLAARGDKWVCNKHIPEAHTHSRSATEPERSSVSKYFNCCCWPSGLSRAAIIGAANSRRRVTRLVFVFLQLGSNCTGQNSDADILLTPISSSSKLS